MQILKKILLFIIGIIALALIAAAFMKKDMSLEKSIVINKPKAEVFEFLRYLKNGDKYSVWAQRDPNMKRTFSGTDGQVGAINGWDSNNKDVGKGEQEIKAIKEGERIDYELRFYVPFESTDKAWFITEAHNANQTKVTWGFYGKMPYPMNLMLAFMDVDKHLGNDLQKGLDNLKAQLEK